MMIWIFVYYFVHLNFKYNGNDVVGLLFSNRNEFSLAFASIGFWRSEEKRLSSPFINFLFSFMLVVLL